MPANLVDERGLSSLQVTHLFGVQLNILQSGLLLYLLLALAMAGLCWLALSTFRSRCSCGTRLSVSTSSATPRSIFPFSIIFLTLFHFTSYI